MLIGNSYVSNEYVAQQLDISAGRKSLEVKEVTVNAAAVTIDTGWKPEPGVCARGDGGFNAKDSAAQTTLSKNIALSVRNFGGLAIPSDHAPVVSGTTGDATLTNATVVFSVTTAGTLAVTLTPPGGYVGRIAWRVLLGFDLN